VWTLPLYGPVVGKQGDGKRRGGGAKEGGKRRPGCRPVGAATVTRGRALGRVRREFQPRPFPDLVSRSFASGVYWREDTRGMKLKRGPMGASRDMECVCDCRGETKAALKGGAAVAQKFECLGGRRRGRGDDSKGDGGPSGPIHGVALGHKASGRDRRGSALRRGGETGRRDGMLARGWDGIALERSTKGDGNSEGGAKGPTGPAAHCQGSAVGRAEGQSAKRRVRVRPRCGEGNGGRGKPPGNFSIREGGTGRI